MSLRKLKIILGMEAEYRSGLMARSIKVSGRTTIYMAKAFLVLKTETSTKEPFKTDRYLALVYLLGRTDLNTVANLETTSSTE
jgi:hypothetical protein